LVGSGMDAVYDGVRRRETGIHKRSGETQTSIEAIPCGAVNFNIARGVGPRRHMDRSVCIRVIRKNVIDLNFNVLNAAQRRSRWNQACESRLADERGVRDNEEIVGGLGLDLA